VSITPDEATLVSADNGSGTSTTMCIAAPSDGSILFNWYYHTDDSDPFWDDFGYSINGNFVGLINGGGASDQSGNAVVNLNEGDIFCFVQNTADGFGGSATTINASFIFSQSGVPVVSDNCSLPVVTFTDDLVQGDCAGNFVITRTWTAEDAAGNTSTCTQTITVEDTTAPVFENCATGGNNLLVNGGFESGDLTGWTVFGPNGGFGSCAENFSAYSGNTTGCIDVCGFDYTPPAGTYGAAASWDGGGPLSHELRQVVTLPGSLTTASLTFTDQYGVFLFDLAENRIMDVNIMDATVQRFIAVYIM
jgi:hypothetical protein